MNKQGKSMLAVSVAAALGAVPSAADAAVFGATLTQVLTYSNNGTAGTAANITSSTATFTYDDVTNLLTQTGGLYQIRLTTAPTTTLYRTSITGLILGNGGVATATTYVCQEGNFGTNVGSSICGNYNFGANFANETTTTWGPGTAVGRTAGGDDNIVGPQQSIAGQDGFNEISFVGTTLVLANKTCTGICTTTTGGFNAGQQWTLTATPLGPVDDTASAEAGQPLSIDVLANDTGLTDPVTVTVTVAPNNGGTATVAGSPGPKANIRINYTSAPGFSGTETFTYRAQAGALDDTGLVTVTVEDTVPTAITFTSQTGVALSTPVTSNTVAIGGISTAVPISVSNGQYSIDGGAFTSAAGTVQNNQDVAVRHTSAATPATDTVTTLTVGGSSTVQGTFTSTTVLPDTVPDAFSFPAQTDVALNTAITSAPATITGINAPAPISVSAGAQYSIAGGPFVSTAGTINNNQSVRVRQTSSPAPDTPTTVTLTVGTVAADFTVTTLGFAFDDSVTTGQNQPVVIDVLQNDVGLAPSVFVGIWINPVHGTAVVSPFPPASPSVIRITYTPNPGYSGPDSFEYWVESGLEVDYAVVNVTVTNPDIDGDGVLNGSDNCTTLANPTQCDSDGDGYGNRCDGDHTGNGVTNAQDTVVMRQLVQDPSVPPTYNRGDINCSGAVNAQDVTLFRQLLGKPPGPSGLVP